MTSFSTTSPAVVCGVHVSGACKDPRRPLVLGPQRLLVRHQGIKGGQRLDRLLGHCHHHHLGAGGVSEAYMRLWRSQKSKKARGCRRPRLMSYAVNRCEHMSLLQRMSDAALYDPAGSQSEDWRPPHPRRQHATTCRPVKQCRATTTGNAHSLLRHIC